MVKLGALAILTDPAAQDDSGVDPGYAPRPDVLRSPDIAVGNVPDEPGWIKGVPLLAVEYADTGQDEADLSRKIADLLKSGTKHIWVVRLTGIPARRGPRARPSGTSLRARATRASRRSRSRRERKARRKA